MSKANSDIDPLHKEVICPVLLQLAENTVEIPLQNVIDQLADYIVEETDQSATFDKVKSLWMKRFSQSAKLMDIVLVKENACWESVFKRINEKASNSNNNDHNNSNTSSSFSSSTSTLKHLLTEEDKTNIKEMFNALDPAKFWYLKATCDQAAKDNVNPESVEEKMKRFALECVYHHPCQSLILDLDDNHWNDVFSEDELIELHEYGKPVLRSLPQDLTTQLECIAQLDAPIDAYRFGNSLEHDPVTEPMMAWLSLTLSSTSYLFLKNDGDSIYSYSETDKLYRLWGFINTIFDGSNIRAISKEKSSVANSLAKNNKRKLLAVEQLSNVKMGHKMDTIYVSGNVELGCLEIGGVPCQTKAWHDSRMKMPFVMKDMLMNIVKKAPVKINEVHVVGYIINGEGISLMDMDSPMGYITRIRRLNEMTYPSSSDDYVTCIVPLLQMAGLGKVIMEDTLNIIHHTPRALTLSNHPSAHPVLPSCFLPSSKKTKNQKNQI